jgi:hypothetical protein
MSYSKWQTHKCPADLLDGVILISEAETELEEYFRETERRYDDEDMSSIAVPQPKSDPEKLSKKYPRAAAWLEANGYAESDSWWKNRAGDKARGFIEKNILSDYSEVLSTMQKEANKLLH